jgi:hypothetical protein
MPVSLEYSPLPKHHSQDCQRPHADLSVQRNRDICGTPYQTVCPSLLGVAVRLRRDSQALSLMPFRTIPIYYFPKGTSEAHWLRLHRAVQSDSAASAARAERHFTNPRLTQLCLRPIRRNASAYPRAKQANFSASRARVQKCHILPTDPQHPSRDSSVRSFSTGSSRY